MEVLESKRLAILAEKSNASEIHDKDILSLLSKSSLIIQVCVSHPVIIIDIQVKANLSADPSKRLSDSVLLDQIVTLIFAGNDTTSLFITWCIHLLSLHPTIQIRLREELLSLRANSSSYSDPPKVSSSAPAGLHSAYAHADAVEALPFLDSVIRETLRICSPVHSTIRTAMQNDIIPISSSIIQRDGTEIKPPEGIPIRKGTFVHIPLQGLNMSEDIWGKDAREFKYVVLIIETIIFNG
jgi:cytochrome P450